MRRMGKKSLAILWIGRVEKERPEAPVVKAREDSSSDLGAGGGRTKLTK